MKIALAFLCIGAVMFLVRVLVALTMEAWRVAPQKTLFHFARFVPSRRGLRLVVINAGHRFDVPPGDREPIAS